MNCLNWQGFFTRVGQPHPAGLPLGAGASEKNSKQLCDVGLMSNLSGIQFPQPFRRKNCCLFFRGKLAEQFVGQELLSAINSDIILVKRDARGNNAETDFLVEEKQG